MHRQPGKLPVRPVECINERSESGDVGIGCNAQGMARHMSLHNSTAAFAQLVELTGKGLRSDVTVAFKLIALLQRPLHCSLEVALHVRATQPRINRKEVRGGELCSGFGIVCRVSASRLHTALLGRKDDASSPRRIMRSLLGWVPLAGPGVEAQAGNRTHRLCVVAARRRKGAETVQRGPRYGE